MSWDREVHDFIISLNKYNKLVFFPIPCRWKKVKTVNKSHNSKYLSKNVSVLNIIEKE